MDIEQSSLAKPNILYVITGLGIGGAEKVVYDLTKEANKQNVNIIVVSLNNIDDRKQEFEEIGIPLYFLNVSKDPISFLKAFNQFRKIIKDHNINLIHTHMFHPLIFTTAYNLTSPSIPVVFTPHSTNIGGKMRELFAFLTRPFRNADVIFSNKHKSFYNHKNALIIPNGIEIPESDFENTVDKHERFTFVTVGRAEKIKNHELMIHQINRLKNEFPEVQLEIVGGGSHFDQLKQLVNDLELQDYVQLKGSQSNVKQFLEKAHVFLLTSKWEGLPIAVLEAGIYNLPVISSDVGTLSDLLANDRGQIYQNEEQLFELMRDSILSYSKWENYGQRLSKYIQENYSITSIFNQHLAVYQNLIQ